MCANCIDRIADNNALCPAYTHAIVQYSYPPVYMDDDDDDVSHFSRRIIVDFSHFVIGLVAFCVSTRLLVIVLRTVRQQ